MKKEKIFFTLGTLFLIALLGYFLFGTGAPILTKEGDSRVYKCNYKSMKLKTEITTQLNGEDIFINGNKALAIVTDPLTVRDKDGNVLGYAGDSYGYITQNDHGIYIGEEFDVKMCGKFSIFRNIYHIKNDKEEIVAIAKFNAMDTKGVIYDMNNKIIATYSSWFLANDYKVVIYENDVCSDMSILMIMASYKSDFLADQR